MIVRKCFCGSEKRFIRLYRRCGEDDWLKIKNYGMRWVATEGIFSAVKRKFGGNIFSKKNKTMKAESCRGFVPMIC